MPNSLSDLVCYWVVRHFSTSQSKTQHSPTIPTSSFRQSLVIFITEPGQELPSFTGKGVSFAFKDVASWVCCTLVTKTSQFPFDHENLSEQEYLRLRQGITWHWTMGSLVVFTFISHTLKLIYYLQPASCDWITVFSFQLPNTDL